jgi:broad specificity phosphatase PhoE/alpha/beta superfamily hydrolase
MKAGSKIVMCRHFETEKNIKGIHGKSDLDKLTTLGKSQCSRLARIIKSKDWIKGITYTNTPQAKASAKQLSLKSGIPLELPLSLKPFNMGIATGISNQELKKLHLESANSIELFRIRAIDATRINIKESENVTCFNDRLVKWWNNEGRLRCENRIVIGSNSTVLMITNILQNILPNSGKYYCYSVPNAAFRVWEVSNNSFVSYPDIKNSIYPEIETSTLKTDLGNISYTRFFSSWSPLNRKCIIAPGYFGNSKHGPYGLYVRIARRLAKMGIETYTFDYLGSGESAPITRTFETDCYSLQTVHDNIKIQDSKTFIIGHSAGCSVVSKIIAQNEKVEGIALAPYCIIDDYNISFFSEEEFRRLHSLKTIIRKGIKLDLSYLTNMEDNWKQTKNLLSIIFLGGCDQYDINRNSTKGIDEKIFIIKDADHNFSLKNSSFELIEEIGKKIKNGSQQLSLRTVRSTKSEDRVD